MALGILLITCALLAWFFLERRQRITHPMAGGLHEDISLPHEQEYELYHNDLSLCSKKARVCLSELGISYKAHPIDLIETGSYETLSRHFLKVNPAGILPVLVHNGHPIYESHDIINYAAMRCTDPTRQLIPAEPKLRAQMQEWVDLASITGDNPDNNLTDSAANCVATLTVPLFAAGIKVIPYHLIFEGILFHRIRLRPFLFLMLKLAGLEHMFKIRLLAEKTADAKTALHLHLKTLDELLADGRPWITGAQFTLADVSWMVIFDRLIEADWFEQFLGGNANPHVQAYWTRLRNRPSFGEAVDSFRHPLVTAATQRIRQQKARDDKFRAATTQ